MKKTWIEREKQFYGEEIDDETDQRREGTILEQPENEEQDDSSDDDLTRGDQAPAQKEQADPPTPSASSQSTAVEVASSKYQVMKLNQQRLLALQAELKEKNYRI